MYVITISYENRNEYMPVSSLWAATQIALKIGRADEKVRQVSISGTDTDEYYIPFTRE